jgi:hypothetical protein
MRASCGASPRSTSELFMKYLITILFVFAFGLLSAVLFLVMSYDDQKERSVLDIAWDGPYALQVNGTQIVSDAQKNMSLKVQPRLETLYSNFNETLFRIANPPVGCRFALEGTISYTNLPDNSAMEMTACYLAKTETIITDKNEGPEQSLHGTSGSRPFIMTLSEIPAVGKLLQLELKAFIGGHPVETADSKGQAPSLTLSNLKLVRYPDPTQEEVAVMMGAMPTAGGMFNWKSFCFGAASTAVLGLAMAQGVVLARHLHKLRAEHEMRQMSSLDG